MSPSRRGVGQKPALIELLSLWYFSDFLDIYISRQLFPPLDGRLTVHEDSQSWLGKSDRFK